MSLLRRRMMGAKQSEFQLVEVENVSVWGYQVSDDAREYGWTLEKPYHLSFSPIANYMYTHMLTDSPFICADVIDADVNVVSDFNVFIPAIGKYSVGQSTYNNSRDLPAAQAERDKSGARNGYPQSEIFDSLGRKWIKIVVAGNAYNSQLHKTISYKSMSVYYCVENDLGKVFPERRWDKHYYVERNLVVVNNRDKNVTNNYFDGLKYHATAGVILQTTPNDAPASYEGNIEGYLIEIPNNVDQVQVFYQGTRSYVARITNDLGVIEIGWNQNSYLYTPVEGDKYLAFTPEYPENITTLYMVSWTEW